MKRISVLSLLGFMMVSAASAQTSTDQPGSNEKELSDLLAVLQQETEVATKTRINSDYVPGIVTVLEGDTLEAMGIATAWEALSLVPGMQPVRDDRGAPAVIARGIDFPFNSGNIQILLNSVALTRADAGINASALLIPIEQIERIEVIRGPGSVVYGDFAFMGLINIITRKEGQRIYGRADNRTLDGGGRASWKAGSTSLALNLSRGSSDHAPSPMQFRNVHERRTFGILSAENGGFSFSAQSEERTYDPTIGGGPSALKFDETSRVLDVRYQREVASKLRTEVDASYLQTDIDDGTSALKGNLAKVGFSAVWDRFARQSLLLAADYSVSTIDQASHGTPPQPGQPPPPQQVLARDVDRKINGVTLQDRIDLTAALTVTLGARYDTYSDLDSRLTPRASFVWRLSDHHILKAQYAEGFRPPTFFELYTPPAPGSNPRYPFEHNDTTEVNYVYKTSGRVGRITLFRSVISDMIRPGGFVTPGHARALGMELEWSQQINPSLKLDTNLSNVNTEDPRVPVPGVRPNPVAAEWLGNLALSYQPWSNTFMTMHVNHVGDRNAGRGYEAVDFTLSRQEVLVHGLGVRAGVKNSLNQNLTYIAVRPNGVTASSQFPGRTAWVQLSWKR